VYTRCPQCQTVFRITAAQLKARDGMVRCGRCQNAFRADQHLVEKPANGEAPGLGARRRGARKVSASPEQPESSDLPSVAQQESPPPTVEASPSAPDKPFGTETVPTLAPLHAPRRPRTRTVYWLLGNALLVLLLVGQGLVFYGPQFVRQIPELQPAMELLCGYLPCVHTPAIDMHRLDLVETQVTPHPRYDRALQIKATLVNRAEMVQPYPRIEVSLIDKQGQLVARRVYSPREYLRQPEAIQKGLPPQVAINIQLDITSPGVQANGYEILLLPPATTE
jgi:predicted Zn finger-like uncharacterized protein